MHGPHWPIVFVPRPLLWCAVSTRLVHYRISYVPRALHRTRLAVNSNRLAASQAWRSYRWSVVRNPLYWLTWLPTMLLIVAGRLVEKEEGRLAEAA